MPIVIAPEPLPDDVGQPILSLSQFRRWPRWPRRWRP